MAVKILENWTWNRKLPDPFDDTSINVRSKEDFSMYNQEKNKIATLHSGILSAILQRMELNFDTTAEDKGAVGSQGEIFDVVEYPSRSGELQTVVYNRNTGKFIAGCYDDVTQLPKAYVFKEDKQSGSALIFALMTVALEDEEFSKYYLKLLEEKKAGFPDLEQAAKYGYVLCDNFYRRVKDADSLGAAGIPIDMPTTGNIAPFTAINLNRGTYNPDAVVLGCFKTLSEGKKHSARKKAITSKEFEGQYILQERNLSKDEQLLVPRLPDWYVIPEEIVHICKHAQQTTKAKRPMRNFLLRGNAGTGKTEGAKAIAAGLGLPYMHLTCSANTEIFDVLGQMMPVTAHKKCHMEEYPTFEDIRMDTSTAYFKLTGEYQDDISEDDVYDKLLEVVSENAKNTENEVKSPQFEYVESPLIQAMRKGYLVEIQEPTVISNPGVLVGLNSLLDTCGAITLQTGERIERHPDTVVVVTTNVGYEGCRALNQSILSRMDMILDMEEPDQRTLIKRVSRITGFKEKGSLELMVKVMKSIQERCRMNMIDDGCCGVRELISWVQSYMVCGDMMEAAKYTILSSASADEENRKDIKSTCIDPILSF